MLILQLKHNNSTFAMNVSFENTDKLNGIITVNIEKADYADKVTKELKEIGKKRDIPGFRKGHIDINTLRKRFGKNVKYSVLNDTAIDAVFNYIKENKLDVLGQPLPAEDHNFNLDDDNVTFKYDVGLAPQLNIVLDKSVSIDFYKIAVTDEMAEQQKSSMLDQCGTEETVTEYAERAMVKGSMLQLNEDGTVKADGIQAEAAIVAPFNFKNADVKAKFEGTKVGDKVVFNPFDTCDGNAEEIALMLKIDRDKVSEANSNFEMSITEYQVYKPAEENQEFYDKAFGPDKVHNSDEFHKAVVDKIEHSLLHYSMQLFARTAEYYLKDTYGAMELPEAFLKRFIMATDKDATAESLDSIYKRQAPALRWEVVESKAAEALQLKVTEEDVKQMARANAIDILNSYGMGAAADQMADYYAEKLLEDEKSKRRLANQAFSSKLFNSIYNAVSLNEHTVSIDEFRGLVAKIDAKDNEEDRASGAAAQSDEDDPK